MLRVDAMDDRKNLRRRLEELQKGTEALDLHQDIILHLLRITDPAAEDEQKTEKGDVLLTIEPKELGKIEDIGWGAYGSVHKINWLRESFAVKYYDHPLYLKERKILTDLSHPHVAQVFDCTISDPCCLVMELMHTDLRNHIEYFSTSMSSDHEALFELPVAVDIMLQIAEGMEYLHRKGIVHRDLKSMNILVNPVSIPEMVDAGYVQAKVAEFSTTIASTSCLAENHVPETCSLRGCFSELEYVGTSHWMAPEVGNYFESGWGNPFKTDVYSFAITCSEILTGMVPFADIRRSDIRARTKAGMRPTLPASLPTSLSSLIECCWDTDARMRPPFSEICAKLRHVKYLLMSVDAAATCEKWYVEETFTTHSMI
jgi:serine/threonine protein kinase